MNYIGIRTAQQWLFSPSDCVASVMFELDLTTRELGELVGVSHMSVSRLRGGKNPSMETLQRIAQWDMNPKSLKEKAG